MHGGISPELVKLKKILTLNRPTDIPSQGMLCDLLWSDPVLEEKGWHENKERGISYIFGEDVLSQFLKANDLDLICRSHQVTRLSIRSSRRATSSSASDNWSPSSPRPTTADCSKIGARC